MAELKINNSLKELRKEYKAAGVFYTSDKLAEYLKSFITEDIEEVYDPTCGSGNLLAVFPDDVAKYGQEIDEQAARTARERLSNATIAVGDTLTAPAFLYKKFKAIVANPPFSIKWTPPQSKDEDDRFKQAPTIPTASKADYAFLLHIVHYLAEEGTAAVLNFPGVLYRGQREGQLRRWLVEQNLIDKVITIEGGYFEDTAIMTALIVFKKGRKPTDTVHFEIRQTGESKEVTLQEIADNDFNLSPSGYIDREEEDKWSGYAPIRAEEEIRAIVIKNLRTSLDFALAMNIEPITPFLDSIEELIKSYRV